MPQAHVKNTAGATRHLTNGRWHLHTELELQGIHGLEAEQSAVMPRARWETIGATAATGEACKVIQFGACRLNLRSTVITFASVTNSELTIPAASKS